MDKILKVAHHCVDVNGITVSDLMHALAKVAPNWWVHSYQGYVEITGERPETDEEYEQRMRQERIREVTQREAELWQLAYLKQKYEGKVDEE